MPNAIEYCEFHASEASDCRICDCTPLLEPDALYLLKSMSFNNFENVLNALEHFMGDLQVVAQDATFDSAALMLDAILSHYAELAKDANHELSLEEVSARLGQSCRLFGQSNECTTDLEWLACHFCSLRRAGFMLGHHRGLTRPNLEVARDVFRGLSFLQTHFDEIAQYHSPANGSAGRLTSDGLRKFIDGRRNRLTPEELAALEQLLAWMEAHPRLKQAEVFAISATDLSALGPESIWTDKLNN